MTIGQHRALSLWGGRSTRQLLRLRYANRLLDNPTFDMAHTEEGVERVRSAGFNWVYLLLSWNFPPEAEDLEREIFRRAIRLYQSAGIQVCGALPVSACMDQGSYHDQDWYAQTGRGRRIQVQKGRYFTCWNADQWLDEVQTRIRWLVEAGVDGLLLLEAWNWQTIVCRDSRCQSAFAMATRRAKLPRFVDSAYRQWQSDLIARRVADWLTFARELNPKLITMIDHAQTSLAVDHVLIDGLLPHDSLTTAPALSAALACEQRLVSHVGPPGDDDDLTAREQPLLLALAEASALGVAPLLKGNGYSVHGHPTLWLHTAYDQQRQLVFSFNQWLERNADWLAFCDNVSPLAIYYPHAGARSVFESACRVLIRHGFPFRVVGQGAWDGVRTLSFPPDPSPEARRRLDNYSGGRVITLQRHQRLFGLGLSNRSTGVENELLNALGLDFMPRVHAEHPVLFVMRHDTGGEQWHLVNYASEPQPISLHVPSIVSGWVMTPPQEDQGKIFGTELLLTVERYKVLRIRSRA